MNLGFGDLVIVTKRQLGPARGFDAAVVVSLSLPTGASAVSSHGYDPFVQLPWSRAFDANWTAAGILSVYWPTQNGRRNVTGETTFLVDRQSMKTWDAFVEYAGDFAESRDICCTLAQPTDRVRNSRLMFIAPSVYLRPLWNTSLESAIHFDCRLSTSN